MTKHRRRKQSRHPCPLCAKPRPNTGLPLAIPFGIPTYWSPEAALAIFEFVDEMRDIILAVYGTQLQDAARRAMANPRRTSGWSSRTTSCRSDPRYHLKTGPSAPFSSCASKTRSQRQIRPCRTRADPEHQQINYGSTPAPTVGIRPTPQDFRAKLIHIHGIPPTVAMDRMACFRVVRGTASGLRPRTFARSSFTAFRLRLRGAEWPVFESFRVRHPTYGSRHPAYGARHSAYAFTGIRPTVPRHRPAPRLCKPLRHHTKSGGF